ncbi:MAG: MlaD family protein [Elainellaceae cyanobacterium]
MRSRTIREGSVGLLVLVGLGILGGLVLWIRGFDPTRRSYRFVVEFPNISGMEVGAPVRYRGVAVGKTSSVEPNVNVVAVELEIRPATLLLPRDVLIQVVQTGLIGETYVDITPEAILPAAATDISPLSAQCDSSIVICNGDRLQGESGVSFSELIGSLTRFTDLFSNPEIVGEIRTLTRNSANAADGIADLSREVTDLSRLVRQELGEISTATTATVTSFGEAADSVALTAARVEELIETNRSSLITTLDSISQTSQDIQQVVNRVAPMIEEGEFLQNLETLSVNAAAASENLRVLTETVGSGENVLLLQQTLDSARATFQNVQKITSDLDELTGDPAFREELRNLVNGLSNLVSEAEELEQRSQIAQMLDAADYSLRTTGQLNLSDPALSPPTLPPEPPSTESLTTEPLPTEPSTTPSTPEPPPTEPTAIQPSEEALPLETGALLPSQVGYPSSDRYRNRR